MKVYEIITDSNSKEIKRVELDITKLTRQPDITKARRNSVWVLDGEKEELRRILYPSQLVFA
jgi:hypothetical protein